MPYVYSTAQNVSALLDTGLTFYETKLDDYLKQVHADSIDLRNKSRFCGGEAGASLTIEL